MQSLKQLGHLIFVPRLIRSEVSHKDLSRLQEQFGFLQAEFISSAFFKHACLSSGVALFHLLVI